MPSGFKFIGHRLETLSAQELLDYQQDFA
jgi:hypothetical protein